jgi:hypothetical protein
MTISFGTKAFPVVLKIWKIEDKGNYALVQASTGRKEKDKDTWVNSNWSFIRFVGKAHDKIETISPKDRITVLSGNFNNEPYVKDGETVYPQKPQMVIFDFEVAGQSSAPSGKRNFDEPPTIDENDIPF